MGCLFSWPFEHYFHRSRVASGGYAAWIAILFDMGLLRLAENRTTVEIHKYNFLRPLYIWHRSIFPAGVLEPYEYEPFFFHVAAMKIMSLNGWGGRLGAELTSFLQAAAPDVLCLQEVVHTPDTDKDWLSYRDGGSDLPQRANFFDEVSKSLPDHTAIFCPAAVGDLWNGDQRISSQWGLATFIRNTLPIVAQHQGFVHGVFSANGYGAHPRSRNAHAVRLFDFACQQPIVIAHMHGLRDLGGKQDTLERVVQARKLAALVMSVAQDGDRIVVCGDFNVLPGSETFSILGELGLSDLVQGRGFQGTRTSLYEKPGRFADYLLVNSAVKISAFEVLKLPEVSDHCPLVLEIGN